MAARDSPEPLLLRQGREIGLWLNRLSQARVELHHASLPCRELLLLDLY
jgi:hypothetical protein